MTCGPAGRRAGGAAVMLQGFLWDAEKLAGLEVDNSKEKEGLPLGGDLLN